jgi:uncharacterized protein YjbI with pentapeptide repeats
MRTRQQQPDREPIRLGVALVIAFSLAITISGIVVPVTLALFGSTDVGQRRLNIVKSALTVIAGIGGVVALVVAYRRQQVAEKAQRLAEAGEEREQNKLYAERFAKAAEMLGNDSPAVRLAGVHALANLADDWSEGRQTCIDVLCAYLRMPPEPEPSRHNDPGRHAYWLSAREVRTTIIRLISSHLRRGAAPSWHGANFDFAEVTFDTDADFHDARFSGGVVNFERARFPGTTVVDFSGAEFSGGTVNFGLVEFSTTTVEFRNVEFSGSTVDFRFAKFAGSLHFSGGTADFGSATFSGGAVSFRGATFSAGIVNFSDAVFSGSTVNFEDATFTGDGNPDKGLTPGGAVSFRGATFSAGTVSFGNAVFYSDFVRFDEAAFSGGTVSFRKATFSAGKVTRSAGTVSFGEAAFSGGTVNFEDAEFSGGIVNFSAVSDWSHPPRGLPAPPHDVVVYPRAGADKNIR